MRFQVQRVRAHYHVHAEPLLDVIDSDSRRCTCLMGSVYYRVLDRIERSGYRVFGRRIGLFVSGKGLSSGPHLFGEGAELGQYSLM